MSPIKIILNSNRDSYTLNPITDSNFDSLEIYTSSAEIFSKSTFLELDELKRFTEAHADRFVIGFLGYEAGYQWVEKHSSGNALMNDVPHSWLIAVEHIDVEFNPNSSSSSTDLPPTPPIALKSVVSKETYINKLGRIKEHIQQGDIYEINYCIPFFAENVHIDPLVIWQRIQKESPMPFSALIDHEDFAIISASPERFIKKQGSNVLIQPMKGTKKRGNNVEEDELLKDLLQKDKKERSENVMIVDLTRNDLSKIAIRGSVKVDELFGVQTFKTVHQMVSTVSCKVLPETGFTDIIKATFPMGSMTGAPKKKAMQLIEEFEDFARGPFSGMLGYIEPNGNFDFNVMIRTIFYSKKEKKLFIAVGSAITSESDVEKEYEECSIKLQPLLKALNAIIE